MLIAKSIFSGKLYFLCYIGTTERCVRVIFTAVTVQFITKSLSGASPNANPVVVNKLKSFYLDAVDFAWESMVVVDMHVCMCISSPFCNFNFRNNVLLEYCLVYFALFCLSKLLFVHIISKRYSVNHKLPFM